MCVVVCGQNGRWNGEKVVFSMLAYSLAYASLVDTGVDLEGPESRWRYTMTSIYTFI